MSSLLPLVLGTGLTVSAAWLVALLWLRERRGRSERARREEEARLRAELERSLQAASESAERFRLAGLASHGVIWDWDLRTDTVLSGPNAAELFGYTPAEWPSTSQPWMRILHPGDKDRVSAFAQRFLRGEEPAYDFRYRGVRKDGTTLHLHTSAVLLRDPAGAPARLVGFTRDITDEVKAEEGRLQAQKLESLGLLAGGIAHDFNNILTIISTSVSVAAQKTTEPEVSEPLATAALGVERAALLTRQLLSYAGQSPLAQRPLALNGLVQAISALLSVSMRPGVTLEQALQAELPLVQGDGAQLQQLVMNLVTNAAEAIGPSRGRVTVRTRAERLTAQPAGVVSPAPLGDVVVLEVQDTGAGMPPEVKAHIFDPFFSTKGGGRGLGLSALAGILRAHGGAVAIDTAVGRGTTFTVYLPALPPEARAVAEPPPRVKATPIPARVLLVDDEPLVRRGARKLLELLGCRVDEATNGREAAEQVEAQPTHWDVVVMDLSMPELGGADAARRMKAVAPRLPVVLTSGYSESSAPEGTVTLAKPYDRAQLESALRRALG